MISRRLYCRSNPISNHLRTAYHCVVPIALTVLAAFIFHLIFSPSRDNVYELGGLSFGTVWPFFTRRHDFMWSNFKQTGLKNFRFCVLQHRVVALIGDASRKAFFNDPGLGMTEGYRILTGGAPNLRDINLNKENWRNISKFLKQLSWLTRKESLRVDQLLPTLFDDLQRRMADWGQQGIVNPFKEVYDLIFQMTVRLATCRELSENKEAIAQIAQNYWQVEKSTTVNASSPLVPWGAQKARKEATQNLYDLIAKYVDLRRNAAVPTTDAIDVLLAAGEPTEAIAGFVIGVVFAGVVSTGINVCWNLLYLGVNPEWKGKVAAEVQALIDNHTDTLSKEPLHKRLSSIPMEAWENEMPALDAVIRETLRLTVTGTLLRRNRGSSFLRSRGNVYVPKWNTWMELDWNVQRSWVVHILYLRHFQM